MTGFAIETDRAELTRHAVLEEALHAGPGEAVARLDRVAVTANNVTYAVHHGPPIHYGRFFPARTDGWLRVPVWGFATVVESRAEGLAEGTRLFGYWPSASHLAMVPGPVNARGFTDTAAHRRDLSPIYNDYQPAALIAATEDDEAFAALMRPLFGTAFALDDALGASPAAPTVILTSASSKTALGTGWCLKRRGGVHVVGLTSARNVAFVRETGCCDRVLSYDQLEQLHPAAPAVLVDFAGNGALKRRLHEHLKGLVASHIVGDTHWAEPQADMLPGPAPAWFFAPTTIAAMVKRDGPAAFQTGLATAMREFASEAADWMTVRTHRGAQGFATAFDPLVAGAADPAIAAMWEPGA